MSNYDLHHLCTIFPRLTGTELEELANDIKINGLLTPIVLHDGAILDGGNRYEACKKAGVEPKFIDYDGDDPAGYVLSVNMYRRHMSLSQFATITALAQDWRKAHSHGGDRKSSAHGEHLASTAARAEQSGASVATQRRADAVAKADADLALEVAHGSVSLTAAVKQVAPQLDPHKPKKPTVSAPPAPEPDIDDDLLQRYAHEVQENDELRKRIDALLTDDKTNKIDKLSVKLRMLKNQLEAKQREASLAKNQARRQGEVLRALRDYLKVDRDSAILLKLKGITT